MKRNNPIAAQQPPPAYANDPTGFWAANLADSRTGGIASILPVGTLTQADNAVKGRLLSAQIGWTPSPARWKNSNITVSISDAQFMLTLESGGDTQPGRITVLVEKLQFQTGFPTYSDLIKIQAAGQWHEFEIVEIVGQHDDNDPSLTLFLEKVQNELGD